eukprot:SAG31_NODE_35655_length_321_cov_0.693694_1_plen_59_part_01
MSHGGERAAQRGGSVAAAQHALGHGSSCADKRALPPPLTTPLAWHVSCQMPKSGSLVVA